MLSIKHTPALILQMARQAKFHILADGNFATDDEIDQYINTCGSSEGKFAVGDIIYVPGYGTYFEDGMCMVIYGQNKATKKMQLSAVFGNSDDAVIDIPLCMPRICKMLKDEGVKFNDILSDATIPQNMDPDILSALALDDPVIRADVIERYTSLGLY